MNHSPSRRTFLLSAAAIPLVAACASRTAGGWDNTAAQARLAQLEASLDGRLGVFALDTSNNVWLGHRADERFPLCSTFKVMLVSAVLSRSTQSAELMGQRIRYSRDNLVAHSPITETHLEDGMTVADLCAAAVQYSDNAASNLLMGMLGGPTAVTAFARSMGDREFRLDRWETDLNTAIPDDPRDTSTPEAMGRSLRRLALKDVLQAPQREQLVSWLRGNTTGAARIRAGVPGDWQVGDKTGSGAYGTANDIAVLWPPQRAPIVVAIYTTRREQGAEANNDVIADAARIVVDWIG